MNALLQQLSPVPLERVGLAQALKDQCEALAYRTGAQVDCEVGELPAENWLPVGAFEALFRVAQEALSNISRHARPSKVSLSLQPDAAKGLLVLSITDDGLGFDPAGTQPGGGLINMRTRLETLGGSFSLKTAAGKGVQLLAALPVHPPEQAEALAPVKADPFLNRAAWLGLGGGILAAAALLMPVYDSIGKYLDWGWNVSRAFGTGMAILAMLIGVLAGFLAARWNKPASLAGSTLSGALTGLIGGAHGIWLASRRPCCRGWRYRSVGLWLAACCSGANRKTAVRGDQRPISGHPSQLFELPWPGTTVWQLWRPTGLA